MSESQWPLLYDVADRIATLVINRPEQRNAIDAPPGHTGGGGPI